MLSRAWVEVDLKALLRNASVLRELAGAQIIPMIKADAYGLGAEQVAHTLESLSPAAYGIATVEEGQALRTAGISRPLLVFTPLLEEDLPAAHAAELTPTLGSREEIEAWLKYESDYHLSIDTGMARAGISWRDVAEMADLLDRHPPAGAFTHFHSAQLDNGSMELQEARFREAIASLPSRPALLHTDSSAAIVRHERCQWDAVRPGIYMYGVGSGVLEPEPVIHVRSRIVELRWLEHGDTVSYDATYTAIGRRLIATLPMGYADGYPRGASNLGSAIVRRRAVPIAGRVTMDMIMLDVTDAGAEIGDIVTLIGDGTTAGAPVSVAHVAELAGLSPYEVLTGLRGRLHRTYRGG